MAIIYSSNFEETIPFSDVCWQLALATATDTTITIPGAATDKYTMLLSYISTSNVFVRKNATAATPGAGTVTTLSYEEFRPGADGSKRYVQGGDVIHFITPDASAYVGVRLMSIPS
jgi:hypothetical protein